MSKSQDGNMIKRPVQAIRSLSLRICRAVATSLQEDGFPFLPLTLFIRIQLFPGDRKPDFVQVTKPAGQVCCSLPLGLGLKEGTSVLLMGGQGFPRITELNAPLSLCLFLSTVMGKCF